MEKPTLYILCGPSGAGKSTWAWNFIKNDEGTLWASRDKIRFSILKDEEDYFSHEKEVFRKFIGTIQASLVDGFNTIADATHLNEFARRKLTQALDMYHIDYDIVYVVFNTNVETCIERNKNREGRANVPETIIRNMCRDFRAPTLDEDERAKEIIEING